MNSKYKFKALVLLTFLCFNCQQEKDTQITKLEDYNTFLNLKDNKPLERAKQNELFWTQKLEAHPNQYPYLGKLSQTYTELFDVTGNIDYLIQSEEALLEVNKITKYEQPSYLKSLAYNYISQHRFKEALQLLNKAELLGENIQETKKMLFDVHLELGNYEMAYKYLKSFQNLSDFDYLIRLSKWSDHKGNLDAAIKYMEKAVAIAEASNLSPLKQWSYTNIADFYGHAGDIEQSYQHYLKALKLNPNDAYAKKGIAWIVYSHEKNPEEALRILNSITASYSAPDYYLLKSEIADHMGDEERRDEQLELYSKAMEKEAYGAMYNKYNVLLYTDTKTNLEKAIAIAKIEVNNRPTPQSYDLLAWSYFTNGNVHDAYDIVKDHVIDKTFEPEILYHIAEIYKAKGLTEDVKPLKKELQASIYELGPAMAIKINQL